jgi:hypothetical protein
MKTSVLARSSGTRIEQAPRMIRTLEPNAQVFQNAWSGGGPARAAEKGYVPPKGAVDGPSQFFCPFTTRTESGDATLLMTGLYQRSDHREQLNGVTVKVYDVSLVRAKLGVWPPDPAKLAALEKTNPEVVLGETTLSNGMGVEMKLSGIEPGTEISFKYELPEDAGPGRSKPRAFQAMIFDSNAPAADAAFRDLDRSVSIDAPWSDGDWTERIRRARRAL